MVGSRDSDDVQNDEINDSDSPKNDTCAADCLSHPQGSD